MAAYGGMITPAPFSLPLDVVQGIQGQVQGLQVEGQVEGLQVEEQVQGMALSDFVGDTFESDPTLTPPAFNFIRCRFVLAVQVQVQVEVQVEVQVQGGFLLIEEVAE